MLIIGEKINSTRESIDRAVRERDEDVILKEARRQVEAGADMLDVNCGTLSAEEEPRVLQWLVETIQHNFPVPLCIDSPNPEALNAGLEVHRGKAMINSISGETERFEGVLPLIKKYNSYVIALCMDDRGIPRDNEQAFEVGKNLVEALLDNGVPMEDIYLDPLVRSIATDPFSVQQTLILMEKLQEKFEALHFVSGLSNVSFGLPLRKHFNRAFVVLGTASGLDAVIVDPLDGTMTSLIYAAEGLIGRDNYCLKYINAYQQGKLQK